MSSAEAEEAKSVAAEVPHGARRLSISKLKTFSSFKNPVFDLYYSSNLCQQAAQNMQQMTRSLLVYRITGSAATLGLVSLAGAVPHILTSLFGGVVADRVQKKYVLLIGMGAFSLVALSVAILLTTGYLNKSTWWILAVNSALQSAIMGLIVPARSAMIREIVGREGLMNAVALNTMGTNGWRLLAPAASGFLIDAFGFEANFYIMAGLYALGTILMVFMPRTSIKTASHKNAMEELKEGFKYIRGERDLMFILAFNLLAVVLAMPYQQMMPVFVDDVLKVGAKGMGILISVSGIGALVGSVIIASLPSKRRGKLLLVGTLILGISIMVFSFSKSWALSLGVMVVLGLGQTARMTLSNTLAQHYTKDEYRGRVMGVYDMEMALNSFSVYGAGVLTAAIGVQLTIGGFAGVLVLVCLASLLFVPRMRRLE